MQITIQKELDATADAVWTLLGVQFADIGVWSEGVVRSSLDGPLAEGSVRTCELKPTSAASGTIRERLTQYDPDTKTLGYVIISGMPRFMRHVENNWTIEQSGAGRARVTSALTIRLAWWMSPMAPVIRRQFSKLIAGFMREMEAKADRTILSSDRGMSGFKDQMSPA